MELDKELKGKELEEYIKSHFPAKFCQLVEDAIRDERAGIEMWDRLRSEFPGESTTESAIIGKAMGFFRDDEKKHLEVLELVKKMKC